MRFFSTLLPFCPQDQEYRDAQDELDHEKYWEDCSVLFRRIMYKARERISIDVPPVPSSEGEAHWVATCLRESLLLEARQVQYLLSRTPP